MNLVEPSIEVKDLLKKAKNNRIHAAVNGCFALINCGLIIQNVTESNDIGYTVFSGAVLAFTGYVAITSNEEATFQNNAASLMYAAECTEVSRLATSESPLPEQL